MSDPAAHLHLVGQTTASLFAPMVDSWQLSLEAEGKSPKTVTTYGYATQSFTRWLDAHQGTTGPEDVTTELCRGWLAWAYTERSPATAKNWWTGLRQFYAWMAEEEEIPVSPMATVKPPAVPEKSAEMLTPGQLRDLLATLEGPRFVDRRDLALIHMYADTGARLSEIALVAVDAVDLRLREATVLGKGRRERVVPFGVRTARAIDRYLRIRARQKFAHSPALWLSGKDGKPLTGNAVQQMFRRRGAAAGIPGLHPHMLRHTFADAWLGSGGQEGDLMELAGWRSRQMLTRYAAKTRSERARAAYRDRSPMDQL